MRVAKYLNAPTLLVVDIERGGAFAHVVGTLQLLDPDERDLIKGVVINKFRGQRSLLESGIKWLEDYTKIPVVGVIPWSEMALPAEDSLDLLDKRSRKTNTEISLSILRLPRIANFTDFDPLEAESSVAVKYVGLQDSLGHPDAVIIPGSKTTIADLRALHKSGMAENLKAYAAAGGTILGICGGFQMLGQEVVDPEQLEGNIPECFGLNLLPVKTAISSKKIARQRQVTSKFPESGLPVLGYEIHQGVTQLVDRSEKSPVAGCLPLFNDITLGIVSESQSIRGCYLHGLFDNGAWRRTWLNFLRQRRGLPSLPTGIGNYREQRNTILDEIASLVEAHLNLTPLFK
jgi:adenosylcobyric acid synthase